jgi:FHS family L-fucose permease-like MFS transporter
LDGLADDPVLTFFGLTKTQTTLLQFAYFIAYLVVAPPMGIFMRRFGYKVGIHVGLTLFSIGALILSTRLIVGAVMYWPAAKFEFYGMFVAFTFVTASGELPYSGIADGRSRNT